MRRGLQKRHLVPKPALPQKISVVGCEYDDSIFQHASALKCRQQFSEQIIDIGNIGIIAMPRRTHISFGHRVIIHRRHFIKPLTMRIKFMLGPVRHLRQINVLVAIQIPKLFSGRIGIMRMRERRHQRQRLVSIKARVIINFAHRLKRHIIIKFKLV